MRTSSPVGAVRERERVAALGLDQLGMDEAARAEVHPVLLLALPPQRHADVPDPHRLGDAARPSRASSLARKAGSPPPGSPATRTRSTLEPRQVDSSLGRRLDQVGGVGRGQAAASGREQLDRPEEALRVAGAERDVGEADPLERGERRACRERPRVVGGDDPLAGPDARGARSCAPSRSPSCRDRRRSAGCSSDRRWCRSSSRSGRFRTRSTQRCAPIGFSGVQLSLSSLLLGERQRGDLGEPAGGLAPSRTRPRRASRGRSAERSNR